MDRFHSRVLDTRLVAACLLGSFVGCAANPLPVPTVWDRLGIPQAAAGLRDSTVNRSGNFPGLEKKPRVLKLSDPANLKAEKPEMIKVAAKIKTDQDLKKQKIKALKFLAEVNCGCYNKDDSVAKAFLAALDDCDPDVRTAAIEGLCEAAGNCSKCRTGCETTCCTEEILKKAQDIATGVDAKGCCKEPVKEIRIAAAALVRKCPCPPAKPIEEVPAPPAIEIEEISPPEAESLKPEGLKPEGGKSDLKPEKSTGGPSIDKVSYRVRDSKALPGNEPVIVAKRVVRRSESAEAISNPDQLISARIVSGNSQLGELLIELPDVYKLGDGWTMVVVDSTGKHQMGRITEASGRRILIALEGSMTLSTESNQLVKMGLVRTN
jgi:hypothetical protein